MPYPYRHGDVSFYDHGVNRKLPQNGKPAAVLRSPEKFDRLTYRARFLEAVDEGLADANNGRTTSDAALGRLLDDEFGKLASE